MSGHFTRKMYDGCAAQQDIKQSTNPLELIMDVNKYVHCDNICKPAREYPPNGALLVDVESSLWGIDKLASRCDSAKHPFCGPNGCLLTNDPRVRQHITPYACERGKAGDNAVITTNMRMPQHPGYTVPNTNICNTHNGYYSNPNSKPVYHSQQPVTHSQQPVYHYQQPITHSQQPVTHSQQPVTHSQQPITHSQQPITHSQQRILPNIRNQQVVHSGPAVR